MWERRDGLFYTKILPSIFFAYHSISKYTQKCYASQHCFLFFPLFVFFTAFFTWFRHYWKRTIWVNVFMSHVNTKSFRRQKNCQKQIGQERENFIVPENVQCTIVICTAPQQNKTNPFVRSHKIVNKTQVSRS